MPLGQVLFEIKEADNLAQLISGKGGVRKKMVLFMLS